MLASNKRGQAMVEFLPSIMIFVLIMSAGMAYFRVMRAAEIRQEAARNLAFAKIDNAGTLTTVDSADDGKSAPPIALTIENQTIPAVQDGNNVFISSGTTCFSVIPESKADLELPVVYRSGVQAPRPVVIRTYAVVCRR